MGLGVPSWVWIQDKETAFINGAQQKFIILYFDCSYYYVGY